MHFHIDLDDVKEIENPPAITKYWWVLVLLAGVCLGIGLSQLEHHDTQNRSGIQEVHKH